MAKTDLTAQRLRELVHYDPETGAFTWRVKPNQNIRVGATLGCLRNGYLCTKVDKHQCYLHRLAWLYMTGDWPVHCIDHIDGNRANNAFSNLRDVTMTVNLQNRHAAAKTNKSCGLLGVCRSTGQRWRASIRVNGQHIVTCHGTAEEAHAAYLAAKRLHHPGNVL